MRWCRSKCTKRCENCTARRGQKVGWQAAWSTAAELVELRGGGREGAEQYVTWPRKNAVGMICSTCMRVTEEVRLHATQRLSAVVCCRTRDDSRQARTSWRHHALPSAWPSHHHHHQWHQPHHPLTVLATEGLAWPGTRVNNSNDEHCQNNGLLVLVWTSCKTRLNTQTTGVTGKPHIVTQSSTHLTATHTV